MFERLTKASIKVVMLAQEEAIRLDHHYVSAEHIFLGLIDEGNGLAAQELNKAGVALDDARTAVAEILGRGDHVEDKRQWWQRILGPFREMPFQDDAQKLLELTWGEAQKLNVNSLDTEHLLLALLQLTDERVLEVLRRCKLDKVKLRASVISAINTETIEKHR